MRSYTSTRYEVLKNEDFSDDSRKCILELLEDKIGYPPPHELMNEGDQDDKKSPLSTDVEEVRKEYNFIENWNKGAGYSSKSLEWWGLCFHHSAGTLLGTIDHLTRRTKSASYHCLIGEDGCRHRFVDDQYRSYHAGKGVINGRNPNHVLLSIAYVGNTVTGEWRKQRMLNEFEIESTLEWIAPRWDRLKDPIKYLSDHKQVDPTRKNDLANDVKNQLFTRIKNEFS